MKKVLISALLLSSGGCGKPNVPTPEQAAPPLSDSATAVVGCDVESPDEGPLGVATFIRGEMNEWGTVDRLCYQGDGIYAGVFGWNTTGLKKFKLADFNWDLQCTKPSDSPEVDDLASAYLVNVSESQEIECIVESIDGVGAQNGLKLAVAAKSFYTIVLDVSESVKKPTLSIYPGSGIPE